MPEQLLKEHKKIEHLEVTDPVAVNVCIVTITIPMYAFTL